MPQFKGLLVTIFGDGIFEMFERRQSLKVLVFEPTNLLPIRDHDETFERLTSLWELNALVGPLGT